MFYMWGRFTVKEDPDFGLLLESVKFFFKQETAY